MLQVLSRIRRMNKPVVAQVHDASLALDSPMIAATQSESDKSPGPNLPRQGIAMKFRYGNGDRPLPGFTIKRGVGIGGFGEVYFATNDAGKEVALKQIQRNLDVEVRGVRHCMNLKHPNLIALYDIQFDADNQGWIVMEYVAGPSLRDALEAYPQGLPPAELQRWFSQIAGGVAYLHDHGIVHRDLKPMNIFEDEGMVKIGDYGLSKFISCSRRGGQTESVGTFHYMAPEIGRGEYGKEIDIYALGIMLYEMATGTVPFDGESSQEIIMKHLTADPDLSLVASPIREVVAKALAKNPSARFSDVRDMVRPLGFELDDRCLPVLTTAFAGQTIGAQQRVPPVVNAAFKKPGYASPPQPARMDEQRVAPNHQPSPSAHPVATAYYREPIARNVREGMLGLSHWWSGLQINPNAKTALLVVAIIVAALNAAPIMTFLLVSLMVYIPYYCLWWLFRSPIDASRQSIPPRVTPVQPVAAQWNSPAMPQHAPPQVVHAEPPRRPGPIPRPAPQKPISFRQWKVAKRSALTHIPTRQILGEVSGGWLGSAAVIAVVSALAALFQIGSGQPPQALMIATVWAALVSMLTAWIAIALGKRWQKEEGDWAIRSFVQLTSGFLVGGVAFGLSEFLMVPWESIGRGGDWSEIPVQRWSGFFAADGTPMLYAYLAYFPLVMGLIHWWKQVDPLRRSRFSFMSVIWSVIAAGLVYQLIPFPYPWGALVFAGSSIAVQLSTNWLNPAERFAHDRSQTPMA